MSAFHAFSWVHALALASVLAVALGLAWHGRAHGGASLPAKVLGALLALEWIAFHAWKATPPDLKPTETLPLQMCHWTSLAAGVYLASRPWRRHGDPAAPVAASWLAMRLNALRPLLYFWGLGLCTQALVTPVLKEGPDDPVFWHFWVSHGMIIVGACYLLIAERYHPGWRDYGLACVATLAYGLAVLPVNLALGANYGFLGRSQPDQVTVVDYLGPWPERLVLIVLAVAAIMALLALPWRLSARNPSRARAVAP